MPEGFRRRQRFSRLSPSLRAAAASDEPDAGIPPQAEFPDPPPSVSQDYPKELNKIFTQKYNLLLWKYPFTPYTSPMRFLVLFIRVEL